MLTNCTKEFNELDTDVLILITLEIKPQCMIHFCLPADGFVVYRRRKCEVLVCLLPDLNL